MAFIYKLLSEEEWRAAKAAGSFAGSAVDHADGYIHFSTAAQLAETALRHFQGRADLVCLEIDPDPLEAALKWEPSRGGDLFPHLYGLLPIEAVLRDWRVPLGSEACPVVALPTS